MYLQADKTPNGFDIGLLRNFNDAGADADFRVVCLLSAQLEVLRRTSRLFRGKTDLG